MQNDAELKFAPVRRIVGPTILLGSGTYFDFENPEAAALTIDDVAYSLAFQSRFTGQCVSRRTGRRVYYPIAQHCVIMAHHAEPPHKLAALMHEVGEATCGDMNAPLKSICPEYRSVEKRCEAAGLKRFGVTIPDPAHIKHLDLRMLATEQRDLMPCKGEQWGMLQGIEPFEGEITPWEDPHTAAEIFLACYQALTETNVNAGQQNALIPSSSSSEMNSEEPSKSVQLDSRFESGSLTEARWPVSFMAASKPARNMRSPE